MIDLGELGHDAVEVPRRAPSPRRQLLPRRWLLVALLAVPLAGSAGPPAEAATWLPEATGVALGESSLYAMSGPDEDWVLTRYELPDGEIRWTTPLHHRDGPASVTLAGAMPLVVTTRTGTQLTTGYDPATGRPRWWREGWPRQAVGDTILLQSRSALAAVDPRTGEARWSIPVDGGELQMYGLPTDLVMVRENRLTRYDLRTGALVAAADLPPGRPYYPASGGGLPLSLLGEAPPAVGAGVVMLSEPGGVAMVGAYDLTTLTRRWQLPGYGWAAPCGPVVCAVAADLSRLIGVDPRSGAVRWSWDCRAHGAPEPPCYVLPSALGPDDPMLVQQWQLGPGGVDTAWLVDPATGREVTALGQWRAIGRLDPSSWLLRWVDEDEPVFDVRMIPPARTWLARLTLDPPFVQLLGAIESPDLPELVWLHARAGGGGRA